MIELQDVTVCYDKKRRNPIPTLDMVSLKIEAGEMVFLVGPSGAGKSSLLKLLYAGIRPDLGSVVVDGKDISRISHRDVPSLRRRVGVVFQDFQLLNEKTAFENVAFALRVIGVPQQVILREVPRALETVGIAHRSHAYPHELSGGEQQRVAIARAIVNDPVLLLADEPTGNLDPQTASQIGDLLERINRERGTTVVLVTHDRELVDRMERRVVRLKDGKIVSDECPGVYHVEDDKVPEYLAEILDADPSQFPEPLTQAHNDYGAQGQVGAGEAGAESAGRTLHVSGGAYGRDTSPGPEAARQVEYPAGQGGRSAPSGPAASQPPGGPLAAEVPAVAEADGIEAAAAGDSPDRPQSPPKDSPVSSVLDNAAPLGSPENPIVLYDR